ncbi:limbic system-associated membrane protein-like isoform X1 [Vanessa tameamea]|uniref:Hemolin n=1 Tax=Vanessa tameamea TaxID=334116 RepID=A0A8B8HGJ1_VANTA|nr:limbic system-associated membrane protein-like isoform X1 [Vanessa tameamea]XP_026483950.1 limbic system-associated membrane protein-like isoform X1 [Vanessa tameamea]
MELKRLSICMALFLLAYIAQCSEARHSRDRREVDDVHYEDVLADEATDDEAQNDAEGNDADEEEETDAIILTQPTNYNATLGKDIRLECKVSPADGVVVQWTRNDGKFFIGTQKPLDQNLTSYGIENRFSIPANSTDLLIKDVKLYDSGAYKCDILQMNRANIEHTLVIFEPPKIIRFTASDDGQIVEGSDFLLTCEVSGSPPPQIVWSRDGENGNKRLAEKDGEFTVNSVFIKNVRREHSGKYYCYAFNGVGSNQAEVYITVKGKPRVHVHKTVVNSAINVEAVLQCAVHDEPTSHIRWYKDGQHIKESSTEFSISTRGQHSNLTVTPDDDQDFGTFTCEAENEFGSHNRSIDLVQSPVVEHLQVDGPRLSWTIHSHQPVEQIEIQLKDMTGEGEWRTLSVPVPQGRNHEYDVVYTLDDQLQSGKYEATVKVKNDKSWSAHTDSAFVEIEAQPQYIQHASVYRDSAHSITSSSLVLAASIMYLLVRM